MRQALVWTLFVLGCTRTVPAPTVDATASLLEAARARPVPRRAQARMALKVDSPLLGMAGSTGGALILDRPGRGHLAVLGPLGGPVATAQTEGTGLALAMMGDHRHLVARDAAAVLRATTGDLLDLDAVLGLLVGELPLDPAQVKDQHRLPDGNLEVVVEAPRGVHATAVLDQATATPVSLVVTDRRERTLASASYAPFELDAGSGMVLPTEVTLTLPDLQLTMQLRYKSWTFPETVPEVFSLEAPEGYASGPLELAGGVAEALGFQAP